MPKRRATKDNSSKTFTPYFFVYCPNHQLIHNNLIIVYSCNAVIRKKNCKIGICVQCSSDLKFTLSEKKNHKKID